MPFLGKRLGRTKNKGIYDERTRGSKKREQTNKRLNHGTL
jgi:hypothetical protein